MATAQTTGEAPEAAPAGSRPSARIDRSARRFTGAILQLVRTALRSAWAARPRGRIRLIDVLRVLGLARRAVPKAVTGPKAYPQWWQRLLALIALIGMVVAIGFVLAAAVGILVVVAGFLLENAIS
jgi:uracil-DNA glycosylase